MALTHRAYLAHITVEQDIQRSRSLFAFAVPIGSSAEEEDSAAFDVAREYAAQASAWVDPARGYRLETRLELQNG